MPHRQEEARKALEGALGEKKSEFEKWDKEIRRREDASSGGNSGGGGWFGWFGGSNGDHFWQEAQQISLTILGIFVMVSTCVSHCFFYLFLHSTLMSSVSLTLLLSQSDDLTSHLFLH